MPDQPAEPNGGRPPVLDETDRRTIIALLLNGSSRLRRPHAYPCRRPTRPAEGNAESETSIPSRLGPRTERSLGREGFAKIPRPR